MAFDSDAFSTDAFSEDAFDFGTSTSDNFTDRFRDGTYRGRFGGMFGGGLAVFLILLAGCIQPPRKAVYDCLTPDYGTLLPPENGCPSSP